VARSASLSSVRCCPSRTPPTWRTRPRAANSRRSAKSGAGLGRRWIRGRPAHRRPGAATRRAGGRQPRAGRTATGPSRPAHRRRTADGGRGRRVLRRRGSAHEPGWCGDPGSRHGAGRATAAPTRCQLRTTRSPPQRRPRPRSRPLSRQRRPARRIDPDGPSARRSGYAPTTASTCRLGRHPRRVTLAAR
jgi:hypothetical protein